MLNFETEKSAVWTCFGCFEFVYGNYEAVNVGSQTHICNAIEPSKKEENRNAFKKFINNISGPKQPTPPSMKLPPQPPTKLPPQPPTKLPPQPPPLPPSDFLSEFISEKKKLSLAELKSLVARKYDVVQCTVEEPKPVKQILKCAPSMATDKKGFISSYDAMNEELRKVLM